MPRASARSRDEASFVLALRRGEAIPFDDIYRAYEKRVRAVCRRYLKDPRDVEEATQDTFVKAHAALPRFNGSFRLGAWLARIAANTAMDVLRRNRRRREAETPVRVDPLDETASAHEELESITDSLAGGVLRTLRPDHAQALLLRMEDATLIEVGDALGKTPSQAKALLHRARESFRKAWQDLGGNMAFVAVAGALIAWRFLRTALSSLSRIQHIGASESVSAPAAMLSENLPTI